MSSRKRTVSKMLQDIRFPCKMSPSWCPAVWRKKADRVCILQRDL